MRCPYCGGIVSDRASYCDYCGRDLTQPPVQPVSRQSSSYPPSPQGRPAPQQPPYQQPQQSRQTPSPQGRPAPQQPPYQQPQQTRQAPSPQGRPAAPTAQPYPQTLPRVRVTQEPVVPPAPEPPATFPPRTLAHLQALEQGALPYTVVSSEIAAGQKKIVRIVYARGVAWQQVATLYKALKEQQEERFAVIIIQGVLEQDTRPYAFTNGQLQFDRSVRLGSFTMNRYQIETETGFESYSVRIVLTEQTA